jgi:hypothetical protein
VSISAPAALRLKREHGMKRLIVILTLASGSLWAQSNTALNVPAVPSQSKAPSATQMYCSGFISRHAMPRTNYVLASKDAPNTDQFVGRDTIFLGGNGLQEGQRYSIIRQVEDVNREDSSPEQRRNLAKLGKLYQEIGWVTVHEIRQGTAIASFDFSCDASVPGDIIVPFREKPDLHFRAVEPAVDLFHPVSAGPTGHILGGRDFVGLLGNGSIVYTDFGANKGVQPGDYLFVRRGYALKDLNKIDAASEGLPKGLDPDAVNQVQPSAKTDQKLPSRLLGEMMVLSVSNESSTALITRAFSEIQLGDAVQREDEGAASAESSEPASSQTHPCSLVSKVRRLLYLGHCGK